MLGERAQVLTTTWPAHSSRYVRKPTQSVTDYRSRLQTWLSTRHRYLHELTRSRLHFHHHQDRERAAHNDSSSPVPTQCHSLCRRGILRSRCPEVSRPRRTEVQAPARCTTQSRPASEPCTWIVRSGALDLQARRETDAIARAASRD